MFVTKYIDSKFYAYIDPWGVTLAPVACEIISSHNLNLGFMPGKAVNRRDMLFNLVVIIDWRVVTTRKKQKVNIDNVCENAR